jgi:hypothetical protein
MSDYESRKFEGHQAVRRAFMTEDERRKEDEATDKMRRMFLGIIEGDVKLPQHKDADHE